MKTGLTGWTARALTAACVGVLGFGCGVAAQGPVAAPAAPVSVIAQGADVATVAAAVREVGGTVTRELGIIQAVAAEVTPAQRRALAGHAAVRRVWEDATVHTQPSDADRREGRAEDEGC
jgi:hypothetical protein